MRHDPIAMDFHVDAEVVLYQLLEVLSLGDQFKIGQKCSIVDIDLDVFRMPELGLLAQIPLVPVAGVIAIHGEISETKGPEHHDPAYSRCRAPRNHEALKAYLLQPLRLLGAHIGMIAPDRSLVFQQSVQGSRVAHRGHEIDDLRMGVLDKILDVSPWVQ